ncbi:hypothetical protein GECvBGOT_gp039c [Salmonella phage GEC_vB_GOT]|nr:hypothetical protein GECvBGOT_gp039c [Salmonella phage GEC_vB_GOT]
MSSIPITMPRASSCPTVMRLLDENFPPDVSQQP